MKNIIVTGANSFVGSAFVKECLNNGYSICAVVHNNHRDKLPDNPSLKIISCEMKGIAKLTELIKKGDYDTFYHFAWDGVSNSDRMNTAIQLNNVQLTV
ncbi:MAG: NAD-dependent epimerase/dehydratase family protein, partial [Synergistaceae bacterium]|nr:NAD-dependent epimerase/dehydratase family protein [Synergistaceae bacterium]